MENHPLDNKIFPNRVQPVYTWLFYQVCNACDMSILETSLPMQRTHDTLCSDICAKSLCLEKALDSAVTYILYCYCILLNRDGVPWVSPGQHQNVISLSKDLDA